VPKRPDNQRWRYWRTVAGVVAAASLLAGPAAYSLTTLGTTTSAIATAGRRGVGLGTMSIGVEH